jgi:hypothetical protein
MSVSNDSELNHRIRQAAPAFGIRLDAWQCLEGLSEQVLQGIICSGSGNQLDLALIDGGHGWPTVFLDFHYMNLMMNAGAVLVIDDLELHSVAELARFLTRQPEWEWISTAPTEKTIAIRKLSDSKEYPDWGGQPYIAERLSAQYSIAECELGNPPSVQDPRGHSGGNGWFGLRRFAEARRR